MTETLIPPWRLYLSAVLVAAAGAVLPLAVIRLESARLSPHFAAGRTVEPGELRPAMVVIPLPAGEVSVKRVGVSEYVTYHLTRRFAIAVTEVTRAQYRHVLGDQENPSSDKDCGNDCPVTDVLWSDAVRYCNRLSELEGLTPCYGLKWNDDAAWLSPNSCTGYRLPTEAEWEVAARADQGDVRYAGTHDEGAVCQYGNVADASAKKAHPSWVSFGCDDGHSKLAPVAKYKSNPYFLYDMTGNVWEWVWDRWAADDKPDAAYPIGRSTGVTRVERGGSWISSPQDAQVIDRKYVEPSWRSGALGFRVARSLP